MVRRRCSASMIFRRSARWSASPRRRSGASNGARAARRRLRLDRDHRERLPASHGAQHRRHPARGAAAADPAAAMARCWRAASGAWRARPHRPAGLYLWRVEYAPHHGIPVPDVRPFTAAPRLIWFNIGHVLVRANCPFAHQDRAPYAFGAGRPVDQMSGLRRGAVSRRDRAQPVRLPQVCHHMRINGRERLLKFLDTGSDRGTWRQGRAARTR